MGTSASEMSTDTIMNGVCVERIREHQQELRGAESHVEHHHVDGEQASAVLAGCPIVEPAFRHHVDARQTNSGHEAA